MAQGAGRFPVYHLPDHQRFETAGTQQWRRRETHNCPNNTVTRAHEASRTREPAALGATLHRLGRSCRKSQQVAETVLIPRERRLFLPATTAGTTPEIGFEGHATTYICAHSSVRRDPRRKQRTRYAWPKWECHQILFILFPGSAQRWRSSAVTGAGCAAQSPRRESYFQACRGVSYGVFSVARTYQCSFHNPAPKLQLLAPGSI